MWCSWFVSEDQAVRTGPPSWPVHFRNIGITRLGLALELWSRDYYQCQALCVSGVWADFVDFAELPFSEFIEVSVALEPTLAGENHQLCSVSRGLTSAWSDSDHAQASTQRRQDNQHIRRA